MPGEIFVTTAYLPPVEYLAKISEADMVYIEAEENYHKQSYRNRCYILTPQGPKHLTVPVFMGSLHKTHIRDIKIDYSKRWQQVHLRTLISAYNSSPFFIYYFSIIEKIILRDHKYLLDLNTELLIEILKMLKLYADPVYTSEFLPLSNTEGDFRYTIDPKKKTVYRQREYFQVFNYLHGFVPRLSIVDLIFNMGPESTDYL